MDVETRGFPASSQPPGASFGFAHLKAPGSGALSDEQVIEMVGLTAGELFSVPEADVPTPCGRSELLEAPGSSPSSLPAASAGSSAFLGVHCATPASASIVTCIFIRTPGTRCRAPSSPV